MQDQIEREEQILEYQLANGEITIEQYNKEMIELQRDYRAASEEAAEEAYRNEMDRW